MAAIFDLSPIRTSGILRSTSVVLSDIENIGIAVGISLQYCMDAEIYFISFLLPVNDSHLWFFPISTSDSLRSSLVVSPYLKNMGITVGISFLSCIEAEVCVISNLLPVNGSNLWFISYSYIGHFSQYFSRVARPRQHRYSRWTVVAIVYGSRDILYFVSTSG